MMEKSENLNNDNCVNDPVKISKQSMDITIDNGCGSEIDQNGVHLKSIMEDVAKVMSAADDPVLLTKDSECYNKNTKLTGYYLSTRKGTRSSLMEQNTKDMEIFLHELLMNIDKRVLPEIEDDDLGGKWIQSTYCPAIYSIECLVFHLTPNRSLDYLEDFKEIPGYIDTAIKNHNILATVLDATCSNKDNCAFRTIFFPHVGKPGPIFMPESIRILLEENRHGLSLNMAISIVDLLCSYFVPLINRLQLKIGDEMIISNDLDYSSDTFLESNFDFDTLKWENTFCICCIFLKQMKIGLQVGSGNWIKGGTGTSESNPLDIVTLIGYEGHIDKDIKPSINCMSNCVNINGYKMSSFVDPLSIFHRYQILPVNPIYKTENRFCVSLKSS